MKWNDDIANQILAALREKVPHGKCPMCGSENWVFSGPFTPVLLQQDAQQYNVMGRLEQFLCVAVGCRVCGNTQLMNLSVLTPDLVEKLFSEKPEVTTGVK